MLDHRFCARQRFRGGRFDFLLAALAFTVLAAHPLTALAETSPLSNAQNSAPAIRLSADPGLPEGSASSGDDVVPQDFAGRRPDAQGDIISTPMSYRVTGVVTDASGLPITGARVTLETRDGWHLTHSFTDATGYFHFDALAQGDYLVVVEKVDYDTENRVVTARAAEAPAVAIALVYDPAATKGKNRAPWAINTSGPQYTGTADVEPLGSWYFEPWVYNERTPSQGTSTYYMPERIALGLGHNFELDFWQTVAINNAGYPTAPRGLHASDWGFGNAHIQLKYEWMADQDTYNFFAWPTISTSADLYIPTGNFTTDLRPDAYNTDQFSNGTVDEAINVLIRKRFKPFEIYAEFGDIVADPTRVGPGYGFDNGIAQVPMGVYEHMVDGNIVWFGAALEHVLNSEYGLGYVLELTGAEQSGSSLFFGHANAPGYSYLWAVPAIEFNWPNTGNLVMTWGFGVGLPVAQSNFPRTYTPSGTVTIYWNGGGPRG